ncbi:MAG: helix-turn-helix transcriptional regulator [Armatimonadetes bacterium]|nr:helix-turn-helix transcriptional regulator [Armatimonadota bacterium]
MLKTIGKEIRQARLKKGWTQAQLAEAAGTFQPIVSRVEQGRTLKQPTLELLDRFAQALGKRVVLTLSEPNEDRGLSGKAAAGG